MYSVGHNSSITHLPCWFDVLAFSRLSYLTNLNVLYEHYRHMEFPHSSPKILQTPHFRRPHDEDMKYYGYIVSLSLTLSPTLRLGFPRIWYVALDPPEPNMPELTSMKSLLPNIEMHWSLSHRSASPRLASHRIASHRK
jgi:hypothetical protein